MFDCREKKTERDLTGLWVDRLTGITDARIRGIHLYLPGYEGVEEGPTLEIFEYGKNKVNGDKAINLEGFGHIAFSVDDVEAKMNLLLEHGGSLLGTLVDGEVDGVGSICLVYARDPEGNIIEIQKWS